MRLTVLSGTTLGRVASGRIRDVETRRESGIVNATLRPVYGAAYIRVHGVRIHVCWNTKELSLSADPRNSGMNIEENKTFVPG